MLLGCGRFRMEWNGRGRSARTGPATHAHYPPHLPLFLPLQTDRPLPSGCMPSRTQPLCHCGMRGPFYPSCKTITPPPPQPGVACPCHLPGMAACVARRTGPAPRVTHPDPGGPTLARTLPPYHHPHPWTCLAFLPRTVTLGLPGCACHWLALCVKEGQGCCYLA